MSNVVLAFDGIFEIFNEVAMIIFAIAGIAIASGYAANETGLGTSTLQQRIVMVFVDVFFIVSMFFLGLNLTYTVVNLYTYAFGTDDIINVKYMMLGDYIDFEKLDIRSETYEGIEDPEK